MKAISSADWMGELPDSKRISELSIPGTHDSGTYLKASQWYWELRFF
jgi:hypothetical protein